MKDKRDQVAYMKSPGMVGVGFVESEIEQSWKV
jgi:hypothetical protein